MENEDVNGNIHAARVFSTEIQASKVESPMNTQHFSVLRVMTCLILSCFGSRASFTQDVLASDKKMVLRLPYRGTKSIHDYPSNYVGIYRNAVDDAVYAAFAGVDQNANVYIIDHIPGRKIVLKCFDRKGKLRAQWPPILGVVRGASVSSSGYVWLGVTDSKYSKEGLPLLAYKLGNREPVVDWRVKVPIAHRKSIGTSLLSQLNSGYVFDLMTGGNLFSVRIWAESLGTKNNVVRALWLLCSSDGSKLVDKQLTVDYSIKSPLLMLDGNLWIYKLDNKLGESNWSQLWVWEKSKSLGMPLLNLIQNREPWSSKIKIGAMLPPDVLIDKKGHIYLFCKRWNQRSGNIERALVVLNKQRHLIFFLPWKENALRPADTMKPRADGTGFYHIEHLDKEARIYFHSFNEK